MKGQVIFAGIKCGLLVPGPLIGTAGSILGKGVGMDTRLQQLASEVGLMFADCDRNSLVADPSIRLDAVQRFKVAALAYVRFVKSKASKDKRVLDSKRKVEQGGAGGL